MKKELRMYDEEEEEEEEEIELELEEERWMTIKKRSNDDQSDNSCKSAAVGEVGKHLRQWERDSGWRRMYKKDVIRVHWSGNRMRVMVEDTELSGVGTV